MAVQVAADVLAARSARAGRPRPRAASQLAAVLAQLGLDVGEAEQRVDLLLGRAGVRARRCASSRMPYSETCSPRRTAASRSAALWRARAGEVLQQVAELRRAWRSAGRRATPEWRARPRARPCRPSSPARSPRARRGSRRARRARRGGDQVEVLDAVGLPAHRAGELRRACPGRPARCRPATSASPSSSARGSSTRGARALGRRPALRAPPARSPRTSAPSPRTVRSRSRQRGLAQRLRASRCRARQCSSRARLGPRPGRRVIAISPAGNFARSRSAAGSCRSRAARGSSPAASCRCPAARRAPSRASAATETEASRTALRRGAVGEHAVDDRAVELVQVAELLERVGDRGVGELGLGHGTRVGPREPRRWASGGHRRTL